MSAKDTRVFYCKDELHDKHVWESDQYAPDDDDIYWCNCPLCGKPCHEVPDRYLSLAKAWANQTGPRTPEGKRRSSLNGYKHGKYAKSLPILAPALPGKFPVCRDCEHREPCENEPYKYCPVNMQPMMELIRAFEEGDSAALKSFAALSQANTWQVAQMMYQAVQENGVLVPKEIRTKISKDGDQIDQVLEWQANPLLSRIPEFLSVLGHTADQQAITPKQARDQEAVEGYLQGQEIERVEAKEQRDKALKAITDLKEQLRKAHLQRAQDAALNDYSKQLSSEGNSQQGES